MPSALASSASSTISAILSFARVLVLVATASSHGFSLGTTAAPSPQVTTLKGHCVLPSGRGPGGTIEAFYELTKDPSGEVIATETVEIKGDGSYELAPPASALWVCVRARVDDVLYYGSRAYLRGRGTVLDLSLIVVDELFEADVRVIYGDGIGVEEADLYFFTNEDPLSIRALPSEAARLCYRVGSLKEFSRLQIAGLPKAGGVICAESEGNVLAGAMIRHDPIVGKLRAEVIVRPAAPLVGSAPTLGTSETGGDPEHVLLAAVTPWAAEVNQAGPSFAYFPESAGRAEFVAEAGSDFERAGDTSFHPVLGAWPVDADIASERPALIARVNEATGRYEDWLAAEPATYTIDFSGADLRERVRLADLPVTGSITVEDPGMTRGTPVQARWEESLLQVTCSHVCPANGRAHLELFASGVRIFSEDVPFLAGGNAVTTFRAVKTSGLTIRVVNADTGEPVPGAALTVLMVDGGSASYLDMTTKRIELVADETGQCEGLFRRGSTLRVVPDPSSLVVEGGAQMELTVDDYAAELELRVVSAVGSVRVTSGQIDQAPFRVSLFPVADSRDEQGVSYVSRFPMKERSISSWEVEATGAEVAAAALRPGATFLFDGVPEGRYHVGVQTGLDLSHKTIISDLAVAASSPFARTVDVKRGEVVEVILEERAMIAVTYDLRLEKQIRRDLVRRIAKGEIERVQAIPCRLRTWRVEPVESELWLYLDWTPEGQLTGQLKSDTPYLLHLKGVGDGEIGHVITTSEGEPDPVRCDGLVELELKGGNRRSCTVQITPRAMRGPKESVDFELGATAFERKLTRGKLRLSGLSPLSYYDIIVEQSGKRGEVRVDPLMYDAEAQLNKRSGVLVRKVEVMLR